MNISIVYEDKDIVVINKPAGLLTHPVNHKDTSESVVSWVLEHYPEVREVQDLYGKSVGQWTDLRPGIVHRLDRETSGLLVIAKNQNSFDYLKKQFQERKIYKTYIALVVGKLKNRSGVIEAPIGKIGTKQTTQIHGKRELKEKNAITEYKVLKEYTGFTLLEVQPLTGRTHQIRAHLKSIGHPIICDPIYGDKTPVCPPECGRLFLHAQKLSLTTPSGQALTLEADLPLELAGFLENLGDIKHMEQI